MFQGLSVHVSPSPRLAPLVLRGELVLWEEAELDESYNTRPEQGQQVGCAMGGWEDRPRPPGLLLEPSSHLVTRSQWAFGA